MWSAIQHSKTKRSNGCASNTSTICESVLGQPASIARFAAGARRVIATSPYGHPLSGTPESLPRIKRDDIARIARDVLPAGQCDSRNRRRHDTGRWFCSGAKIFWRLAEAGNRFAEAATRDAGERGKNSSHPGHRHARRRTGGCACCAHRDQSRQSGLLPAASFRMPC